MPPAQPVAVIGAGSWGTALAVLLAGDGRPVRLWSHEAPHVAELLQFGENKSFLPGISLPTNIQPTGDLAEALRDNALPLLVIPSHAFRSVLEAIKPLLGNGTPVAWATKGLDPASGNLLSDSAAAILGSEHPLAIVSGPSFAAEVAKGLPTAVTVAASDPAFAQRLAELLRAEAFRTYYSEDLIGVQIGGAVKNVLAIAAGIADGLGFGANTRAALITRGLAEIIRLGESLGASRETLMGLAGLGDLVLTCTDDQSRNRRMGLALAKGLSVEQARKQIGQEVEGVFAAREVRTLAKRHGVEMPIAEQVYQVLYKGLSPRESVQALLARDTKAEF